MKKILGLILFTAVCFVSCQKEIADYVAGSTTGGNNNGNDSTTVNPLKGTWNFDSLSVQSQTSSDVVVDGTDNLTLSTLNYRSFGNNGTLAINDSLFNMTGYTYSISTIINAAVFQNGVFIDSANAPFNYYVPPTNSSAKYKLIGTDSVYFPEGGFLASDSSSASTPYGLKFKINGSSLVFTQQLNLDTTFTISGITKHDKSTGAGYLYFHKK